nr:MAG TPA: hypothetical protein [Caudoviricetes sp.]
MNFLNLNLPLSRSEEKSHLPISKVYYISLT